MSRVPWSQFLHRQSQAHLVVGFVAQEVARRLKIDEASAESAMYRAIAERWLVFEGSPNSGSG